MTALDYLYNLLNDDTNITSLLTTDSEGDPAVFQAWYDELVGTPQITILRLIEINEMDHDDVESILVTPFQVDIWVDKGSSAIEIETAVRQALIAEGIKTRAQDLHEETINRVSITFEIDGSMINL